MSTDKEALHTLQTLLKENKTYFKEVVNTPQKDLIKSKAILLRDIISETAGILKAFLKLNKINTRCFNKLMCQVHAWEITHMHDFSTKKTMEYNKKHAK